MDKRALILVGLLCLTGIACAQISENYDLSWNVIGGGGGAMDSASYAMRSTVGQITGLSSSTNYQLGAGYSYGDLPTPSPYPKWDINEDGITNYLDAAYIGIHYGEVTTEPYPRYDINKDGVVNYLDAAYIGIHYGESTT